MTPPHSLWHLRSFLWRTKPRLCVKQICLPSVISNLKNNKSELRKTVRPTGFKKTTIERIHSRDQHLCKFMGRKESFYERKESNSHRICLEHQYGRRDVMWKRPIAIRFNLLQVCASLLPFVFPVLFITSFNSLSDYLFHSIWWQFPLFCLVAVRRLSRPSRSMHFSDVSEKRIRNFPGPRDRKRIGSAQ